MSIGLASANRNQMLFIDCRRRGCGKCGKAEAFFAEAFPSSLWKSSRRNRRRQPLSISIAAAFSTAFSARRLFRFPDEVIDIRNGKNSSKVRSRFQTSTDRADRGGSIDRRTGRTRPADIEEPGRAMARSISKQRSGRSSLKPGAPIGSRKRETQGQDWRSGHADRAYKKTASLGSAAEKRRYIRDHREELGSVSKACQVSKLSPSSYYYKPDPKRAKKRDDEDDKLRQQIDQIHEELPGYGYRRIVRELKRRGIHANGKRIRRLMKKFDLRPITWRTFVRTTDSAHTLPVYPNLLRERQVRAVNQVWVADITYIRIRSSFVYLAAILDLYSRKVVGWAISKRIDTELCSAALQMALKDRPARGCIHHSDRGVQYASAEYVALLRQHGLQISMSRKANPYDNAFMESFYKTLKYEEVHLWELRNL